MPRTISSRWPAVISFAAAIVSPESAGAALLRGAFHVLSLLMPYLEPAQRDHLHALAGQYEKR